MNFYKYTSLPINKKHIIKSKELLKDWLMGGKKISPTRIAQINHKEIIDDFSDFLGLEIDSVTLLVFKSVENHNDEWKDYYLKRKGFVKPGFLHLVISGNFSFAIGKKEYSLKKGDLFLMNPNVNHSVKSNKTSMSICFDVPMHHTHKMLKEKFCMADMADDGK